MTLSEFKFIYFWEWFHRVTGRLIGLVFFFPMLFFWIKGRLEGSFRYKVLIGFILGGMQGLLGWYMVKSGLIDRPDVSHFRLAAHLGLAFVILAYLGWLIFDLSFKAQKLEITTSFKWGMGLLVLVALQIVYGAFTAGLDAGLSYNTFPTMGRAWFPDFLFETGLSSIVEHNHTIQFIHRWLGKLITVYVLVGFFYFRHRLSSKRQKIGLSIVSVFTITQVVLGIITLIYVIPLSMAVTHQVFAAVLLVAVVHFLHSHKVNKQI
jgi:cytochrome c oxidase assembly protein subunit 15